MERAPQALALKIETPDGALRGTLVVPDAPLRLAELAWNTMGLADRLVGLAVRREERGGKAISCRRGCGACCRQPVPLSPPEAWMIADVAAGVPASARASLMERFASTRGRLAAAGLDDLAAWPRTEKDDASGFARRYFALGLPCPFLVEESCSIHPVRPAICREYLVTSPAENCAAPTMKPIHRVAVPIRLSISLARLTGRLLDREPEVVPLPLALDWAEAHREEGLRRWDGRRLLEMLAEDLGRRPGA